MNQEQTTGGGFFLLILIVAAVYYWHQSDDLKKQLKQYQDQSAAYELCVSGYEYQQQKFKTAIRNASDDLDLGGVYEYRNAQDELSINTTDVSCDVPTISP